MAPRRRNASWQCLSFPAATKPDAEQSQPHLARAPGTPHSISRRAHCPAPLAARVVARRACTHWRLARFLCVPVYPDMPGLGPPRTLRRAAAELLVQAEAVCRLLSARRACRCARRRSGRGGAGARLLAQRAYGHRRPVPPRQPHAGAQARRQPSLALHPAREPSGVRLRIPGYQHQDECSPQ